MFMERETWESGGKKSTRSIAPNKPLVKNSCNPSFTKLSKLSNDLVLEWSIAPASNQFLNHFFSIITGSASWAINHTIRSSWSFIKKLKKKKKKSLLDHFKVPWRFEIVFQWFSSTKQYQELWRFLCVWLF